MSNEPKENKPVINEIASSIKLIQSLIWITLIIIGACVAYLNTKYINKEEYIEKQKENNENISLIIKESLQPISEKMVTISSEVSILKGQMSELKAKLQEVNYILDNGNFTKKNEFNAFKEEVGKNINEIKFEMLKMSQDINKVNSLEKKFSSFPSELEINSYIELQKNNLEALKRRIDSLEKELNNIKK